MSWQTDRQLDLQEIDGCSVDITAMDQVHHLSWVVAEMFETYLLHDACIVSNEKLYEEGKIMYSTVDPGQVSIFLDKTYEKEIRLSVGGKRYSGEALINFISEDVSKTVSYPEQTTVELSEGEYDVQVYVYDKTSLTLPGTTQEYCVEVPRGTILGSFGLTKEECYDVEIPSQIVSSALAGGGKENYYILESELASSNVIEISASSLTTPTTIDQLSVSNGLYLASSTPDDTTRINQFI